MKLTHDNEKKKWLYPFLAFAIPFFSMILLMIICQVAPFGQEKAMLQSDRYHQYFPFFMEFRRALRRGELIYNWSVGMGMDYLGLISYYLASPLNLLTVFLPENWMLGYFSLLTPLKLGLASLFFALFLKGLFGKNNLSVSFFGSFYGLCAWALGYHWNAMWLDTFAVLPLVVLGMVYLLRDKRFLLYTLTLFFSVYANYYVGLFTCIFIFLAFFCWEICNYRGMKPFFMDLLRIACFSALAIGMTLFLELPALAALQNTQSSNNSFPREFRLNIADENTLAGLLQAMRKVTGNMGGGLEPTFVEGLPNLYCGVGCMLLAVLMLFSRKIKVREKLCCVFLLVFFQLSFIIRQLDYIWHGFHFPNMIPYRFSFLYSFVVVYMAYRAWMVRNSFPPLHTLVAGIFTMGLLSCSESFLEQKTVNLGAKEIEIPIFLIYNGVFLLLYLGALLYSQIRTPLPEDAEPEAVEQSRQMLRQRRIIAVVLTFCIFSVEIGANLANFGMTCPFVSIKDYPSGKEASASMIRYMKEREEDNPFFRAEVTRTQTYNDGALNGYNGITAFTSSANVKVTNFMEDLGYGAYKTYNRYAYEEGSPVGDLFLGIKYMLERNGRDRSSSYYTDVHHYQQIHLLENQYYLPLGFLTEQSLADLDFNESRNDFQFQNTLLAAASGRDVPVWHMLDPDSLEVTGDDFVTVESVDPSGRCDYQGSEETGKINYRYVADRGGYLCLSLDMPKRNYIWTYVNDELAMHTGTSLPQIISVKEVRPGDEIRIETSVKPGEDSHMVINGAILDQQEFEASYQVLAASVLELNEFSSTHLEGTIDCNRDGLLYTSIPQNGNWNVSVDGVPVEEELVADVMISVPLTEGSHTISFSYANRSFYVGSTISLICAAILLLLVWKDREKAKRNRKEQPDQIPEQKPIQPEDWDADASDWSLGDPEKENVCPEEQKPDADKLAPEENAFEEPLPEFSEEEYEKLKEELRKDEEKQSEEPEEHPQQVKDSSTCADWLQAVGMLEKPERNSEDTSNEEPHESPKHTRRGKFSK